MGRLKYKDAMKRKRSHNTTTIENSPLVEEGAIEENVVAETVEVDEVAKPSSHVPGVVEDDSLYVDDLQTSDDNIVDYSLNPPEDALVYGSEIGIISEPTVEDEADREGIGSPHLTGWEIVPSLYGLDNSTLVLTVDGVPAVHMEITPESVSELLYSLNDEIGKPLIDPLTTSEVDTVIPDSWAIRVPEDSSYSPILYFKSEGKVLSAVDLDKELLDALQPKLKAIHGVKEKPKTFMDWVSDNRVKTTLVALVVGFVAVYGALSSYVF